MKTLLAAIATFCLVTAACGSDDPSTPTDSGAPAAGWNEPIDPPVVVDGLATSVGHELPVVASPSQEIGDGLLDASFGAISSDDAFVYIEIGRAAGCATFEHLALTPTGELGVYALFYDTDNACEAFGVSGYRIPIAELETDSDGTVTLLDTNGNATGLALD